MISCYVWVCALCRTADAVQRRVFHEWGIPAASAGALFPTSVGNMTWLSSSCYNYCLPSRWGDHRLLWRKVCHIQWIPPSYILLPHPQHGHRGWHANWITEDIELHRVLRMHSIPLNSSAVCVYGKRGRISPHITARNAGNTTTVL